AGILPVLLSLCITVVPDGFAGIRVSQFSGVRPGTLYPGVHILTPFIDNLVLYDKRERVYSTAASAISNPAGEILTVQAREAPDFGLSSAVGYCLDPTTR